jgi:hypothetical protein
VSHPRHGVSAFDVFAIRAAFQLRDDFVAIGQLAPKLYLGPILLDDDEPAID